MAQPAHLIDMSHFEAMTCGDKSLQKEVLGLFRVQSELWMRLLNPDAPETVWRDAAHSLKGSARGIGAFDLAEACAEAEDVAKVLSNRQDVARRLEIVRARLQACLSEIEHFESITGQPLR
jgi:HPt (histidine-containing phosphotransfer) domain-containing protein